MQSGGLSGSLERRSGSSLNLKRMDLSPPGLHRAVSLPMTGSNSGASSSSGSPTSSFISSLPSGKRNGVAVVFLITSLGVLTMLLSLMVYNTARLGFRSISTSYVNVNYMPHVVNNNGVESMGGGGSGISAPSLLKSAAQTGAKLVRMQLMDNYRHQGNGKYLNTPRNAMGSWPAEQPNWEKCRSRDEPDQIRTTGSVFGYFPMYMRCPAAPEYRPTLSFEPPHLMPEPTHSPAVVGRPDLLIGVFSSCGAINRRDTVRNTWARLRHSTDATVRIAFVLARDCEEATAEEQAEYADLTFMEVRESYFTLTPKALGLLQLGLDIRASYILKTDDDSFIFIDRVMRELRKIQASSRARGDTGQPCLYWGRRCSVPSYKDSTNPRLAVYQTAVSKWYYPPHYLRHFEGTAYMCGAAYLLSNSLAAKVIAEETNHQLSTKAPFLPEDASVGHLAGPSLWESCSCEDYRYILDARRFNGRHLFGADVPACKLRQIFSHALTAHGLKPEHMERIISYGELPTASPGADCTNLLERDESTPFDEWVWQEPLPPLQAQFPEINWQKRLQNSPTRPDPSSGLVPLASLLKAVHTPWCIRHKWAIEVSEQLVSMSAKQTLECMLGMDEMYVDAATMEVKLNDASDTLVTYPKTGGFARGIPCYADNMCDRCFLPESREGMFGNLCSPRTWTCQGYTSSHQTRVAAKKVLYPLIGRFMHDTPPRQDRYRSAVDAALKLVDVEYQSDSASAQSLVQSLTTVYKSFKGEECAERWLREMSEQGETELIIEGF